MTDLERAAAMYPDSPKNQAKWLAAVKWLRECSRIGYAIDGKAAKIVARPLLHGYTAPLPALKTVVSLPDDKVIPGISIFRRGSK